MTTNQEKQTINGTHIDVSGNLNAKQIGDRIHTEGGDYVRGDKHVHIHQERTEPVKPFLSFEPETAVIPAGPFLMGDENDPLTAPQHSVDLPAFAIGVYPVTNEQFAHFLWKTGRVASNDMLWDGNQPPSDQLHHPVTGVTWFDALAYCNWLSELTGHSYTLPNEAQWEKAARGIDGRIYPWGNEWQTARCHTDPGAFAAVDAFPAQSQFGGFDMVGNAREWTATLWGTSSREPDLLYRYPWADDGRNILDAPPTTRRIFRGGRGQSPADYCCTIRGSALPDRSGSRRNRHGFRVLQVVSGKG